MGLWEFAFPSNRLCVVDPFFWHIPDADSTSRVITDPDASQSTRLCVADLFMIFYGCGSHISGQSGSRSLFRVTGSGLRIPLWHFPDPTSRVILDSDRNPAPDPTKMCQGKMWRNSSVQKRASARLQNFLMFQEQIFRTRLRAVQKVLDPEPVFCGNFDFFMLMSLSLGLKKQDFFLRVYLCLKRNKNQKLLNYLD
jgi:hypothetical protein